MWHKISLIILRNRVVILSLLALFTGVMAYFAQFAQLDYNLAQLLPEKDSTFLAHVEFKKDFGKDGNVLVIGAETPKMLNDTNYFNNWYRMGEEIKTVRGIDSVFSITHLFNIKRNKQDSVFEFERVMKQLPRSNLELDSIKDEIYDLPFYNNIVRQDSGDFYVMMVFVNPDLFDSKERGNLVGDVKTVTSKYVSQFPVLKYSGLPFIRSSSMTKVRGELGLFVLLAMGVTSFLLWLFFRSVKVVLVSLVVVVIGVVVSFGLLGLSGFKITILMGLIPPLIIVIGIPNCIYLINKYQQEYMLHGNKGKALSRVIQKVGNATFLTNVTTALGFATFIFTESSLMRQFGILASINIITVFFLAIIIVPIAYSYLSPPKTKHTKHLDRKWLYKIVDQLVVWSTDHRPKVYIITLVVLVFGGIGISKMKVSGNIAGDLPKGDEVRTDLAFFEKKFKGVLPFEIILEAKTKEQLFQGSTLEKIETIQNQLAKEPNLSKSISIVDGLKFLRQAYFNGNPNKYELKIDGKLRDGIVPMLTKTSSKQSLSNGFVSKDSLKTRISSQVADLGTLEMDSLVGSLYKSLDTLVNPNKQALEIALKKFKTIHPAEMGAYLAKLWEDYPTLQIEFEKELGILDPSLHEKIITGEIEYEDVDEAGSLENTLETSISNSMLKYSITGTSIVFTKGTNYLVSNLFVSLLIAICIIAAIMAMLFRSVRMVFVSLLPNLIPLIVTAAIMGYFGVPIKPSTILVFSVAFGISVDDTIHFLAKYRQELKNQSWDIKGSVIKSIRETGVSMIYTSIILFFGFGIFVASNFGGTQALGVLVSVTLLVAMLANLVLLPSLLLSLEKRITTKAFREPLLDLFDEEDDIELESLEVENTQE